MLLTVLKSKLHRVKVTEADLNYEGSVSICPDLIKAANFHLFEQVDIYNVNTGARFHTYVIKGKKGQICLNGAAARHVQPGDLAIIACYAQVTDLEIKKHKPVCVFVDDKNRIKEVRNHG